MQKKKNKKIQKAVESKGKEESITWKRDVYYGVPHTASFCLVGVSNSRIALANCYPSKGKPTERLGKKKESRT
jgi:hypothetical protein